MKKLLFILSVVLLASCGGKETSTAISSKDTNSFEESPEEIELSDEQYLMDRDYSPSMGEEVEAETSVIHKGGPYSNPFFIYGSDFGAFFQTLYTHGKYDDMLAFTSSQSINQFGKDNILEFYKKGLDFGYDIKLKSNGTAGDVITINYEADIMATKKIVRINVVVENDSCKILLPNNLNDFPG